MFSRFGKIEEESALQDLDTLEAQMAADMDSDFTFASSFFAPPKRVETSGNILAFTPRVLRGRNGLPLPPIVRSSFFPGQDSRNLLPGKAPGASQLLGPVDRAAKKRDRQPANDTVFGPDASKFAQVPQNRSRFMEALVALGFLRYAKDHKFNSALRLEKGLAEGHEDAEQFLRANPKALKKDTFKPT